MITANTTPFCLSPLPLGTEIGCGAQSWFSGEGWGGRPLRRGPGEVGCPSDMSLLHCPGTSFPCQEAPPQAVAHDGIRAWDSTGRLICSHSLVGSLRFHQGSRQGHRGTQKQNRKIRKSKAASANGHRVAGGTGTGLPMCLSSRAATP